MEKIPFVFLPLSVGQQIYPSAQIQLLDGVSVESEYQQQQQQQPICLVTATDVLYKDGWHNLEKIYNEFSAGDQEHFYHHPIRLVQTQSENSLLLVSTYITL